MARLLSRADIGAHEGGRYAATQDRRQCRDLPHARRQGGDRGMAARRRRRTVACRQLRRRARRARRRARAAPPRRGLAPGGGRPASPFFRPLRRGQRMTAPLHRLAAMAGIATEYRDAFGQQRQASPETLRALLAAMGFRCGSDADAAGSLAAAEEAAWLSPLDAVTVIGE